MDVVAIGNENDVLAVGRPRRADFVVEGAVIVTRQGTAVLSGEPLEIGQFTIEKVASEDVEAAVERGGNKCNAFPVGRESRLEIDSAVLGQGMRLTTGSVQGPKFHGI